MRVPIEIPLGFYQDESLALSAQRCINWIPTVSEGPALNPTSLKQPYGLTQLTDTGLGACRGKWVVNGVDYSVNGTSLVSISSTGVVVNLGTIAGSVRVDMADNGTFLVIVVPGGNGYTFDTSTSTFEQIVDPDYQTADTVRFYRGVFVFTASDGKQLFISNLNQPLVFDALDFGSAEGDPDRIVTQVVDHDELSIIGSETTEVFRFVGGVGFPLQIIPGAFTQKGAHSKYGAVEFDSTYLFLGGGKSELTAIWRQTSSSSATKISTNAIDNAIQKFTKEEIAESFAMTFSKQGQFYAVFTFESIRIPSRTFVYNGTASGLSGQSVWFELQTGMTDNSWRANAITKAYGKLLVGDSQDGRIGIIDDSVFTEYGNAVLRQAATKPYSSNGTTVFAGELEATFQAGIGLTTGQGSDPVVIMDFSDDQGQTFSTEFKRPIGKIGEYGHETVWNRQGRFPDSRTIRFTVTDPVNANLIRIAASPELGNN
jgi:hypothetical protein